VFDILVSVFGLVALSPVMVMTAMLVWLRLGRPVVFTQERPGRGTKVFKLRKFRTMKQPDPSAGLVTDQDRMTRLGSLLRGASLDELPTFWNVLRGDMSLVGPRPLLVEYLDYYTPRQLRRHEVRPGVTGLAQINGRNETSWEDRLELDVQYVDSRTWRLDLEILVRTVGLVLRRSGVAAAGHVTMPEFKPAEVSDA
jgi:lipopolysaccharide/colanic/teichoic acid biosynthesis glycosyltransferase